MTVLIVIFIIVSIILAISTLGYVAVDVVLEVRGADREKEPKIVYVPAPAPEPVPEPEPEPVIELVEEINADDADKLLSDANAMKTVLYENGAGHGKQGIINIGVISEHFEANETVTIAALKQKGLVPKNVGRIKVLAYGVLDKPLTIKSEAYSVQAIKMIELTGGTVIILKD